MDLKTLQVMRRELLEAGIDLTLPPHLLGRGTYSLVYAGTRIDDPKVEVAVRFAYGTTKPRRSTWVPDLTQLLISGEGCVVPLIHVIPVTQAFPHSCLITVMPRIRAISFRKFIGSATITDIRRYMSNLLVALEVCAEYGIVHRDVKPKNFLWDNDKVCHHLRALVIAHLCIYWSIVC